MSNYVRFEIIPNSNQRMLLLNFVRIVEDRILWSANSS